MTPVFLGAKFLENSRGAIAQTPVPSGKDKESVPGPGCPCGREHSGAAQAWVGLAWEQTDWARGGGQQGSPPVACRCQSSQKGREGLEGEQGAGLKARAWGCAASGRSLNLSEPCYPRILWTQ